MIKIILHTLALLCFLALWIISVRFLIENLSISIILSSLGLTGLVLVLFLVLFGFIKSLI